MDVINPVTEEQPTPASSNNKFISTLKQHDTLNDENDLKLNNVMI